MGAASSNPNLCSDCQREFHIITRRKKRCNECAILICLPCSTIINERQIYYCRACNKLLTPDLIASDLNDVPARLIQKFLRKRQIELIGCSEKEHFVELFLMRYGGTRHQQQLQLQQQETERLLARNLGEASSEEGSPTRTEPARDSGDGNRNQETDMSSPPSYKSSERLALSDVRDKRDIATLTARQLKVILATNLVNYKGCKEKPELISRVEMLWDDHQIHRANDSEDGPQVVDMELCKVCMDAAIDCVLLECGHMSTCTQCGKQMNECPICRRFVVRAVHIFKA